MNTNMDSVLEEYLEQLAINYREQVQMKLSTDPVFKEQLTAAILNLSDLIAVTLGQNIEAMPRVIGQFFTIIENIDPLAVDMYSVYMQNYYVPINFTQINTTEEDRIKLYVELQQRIYSALNID